MWNIGPEAVQASSFQENENIPLKTIHKNQSTYEDLPIMSWITEVESSPRENHNEWGKINIIWFQSNVSSHFVLIEHLEKLLH